ncbi:hypothetical protein [Rhizohabitans arisaemae]|uniref:hypothetical protein n=1 Tax=Rhizohabitans arisaemae TaxID=2720610 RepID=UPI0024B1C8BE|nr:hypothetical protein [Rhizohabitans arisaemae]
MKKGINYDTGFLPGDQFSRKVFDAETVRREMRVIADDLHCQAIRVSGDDPARLSVAAQEAAEAGLEVWFAPFPVDLPDQDTLAFFTDCAERAEAVRRGGAEVVFVTGCEYTTFGHGYLPGDTYTERMDAMMAGLTWLDSLNTTKGRFNAFLAESAETVRSLFNGRITYASGSWEFVDWAPFDLVGVDAYRTAYNADTFVEEMRGHFKHGKPVVVTEFGTCAWRGAAEQGGAAMLVPEGAVPDEGEQVRYFEEMMDIFEKENVDAAFWFSFAGYALQGAADIGSYGVVRMLDATRWEPKAVFHAMATRHARGRAEA